MVCVVCGGVRVVCVVCGVWRVWCVWCVVCVVCGVWCVWCVGTTGKARQGVGDRSLTNHFQTGLAVSCHQLVSQSDLCWPLDMQTLNVIHYVGLTIS